MPTPTAATDFSAQLRRLIAAVMLSTRQSWQQVPADNIVAGWAVIARQVTAQVAAAQIAAARFGDAYVPRLLEELGIDPASVATVEPRALAVGSSGVDLPTVLGSVPLRALHVASTAGVDAGLDAGGNLLDGIVATQVADAGRLGTSLRMVASPHVSGYIREVSPGACARCLLLAGKWYRWSSGFLRHPHCQCINVPVGQAQGKGMVTDADSAFRSMSKAEQDRVFTTAGAKAIRDGADINRVVNARRGTEWAGQSSTRINERGQIVNERHRTMTTRRVFGQDVFTTTEGATTRGVVGAQVPGRARLMPESIYALARDREDAIRLLRLHGYLR